MVGNIPRELAPCVAELTGRGLSATTIIIRGLLAQRFLDPVFTEVLGEWAALFEQGNTTWQSFESFCRADEKRRQECVAENLAKLVQHEYEKEGEQPAKRKSGRAG